MIMSLHSQEAHRNERWSAERVYDRIWQVAHNPTSVDAMFLTVKYCPHAVNRTHGNPNRGKESPQVRAFLRLTETSGIMAVYGIEPRVYITGYQTTVERFAKICKHDRAEEMTHEDFIKFLNE